MEENLLKDKSIQYRQDIEILRGILIFVVVMFHFFPLVIPGGFAAIDVFIVISGYLMCSILIKSTQKSDFDYLEFYLSRAKRILPSLLVFWILVLLSGFVFLTSKELIELGQHAIAQFAFANNYVFIYDSNYFQVHSEWKSVLNLWSLAVEVQFYLSLPLVAKFCLLPDQKRGRHSLLFVLMLLSFIWSIYRIKTNPTDSYFSPLTRYWEFSAGIMVALYKDKFKFSSRIQSLAFHLGLVLILGSFFIFRNGNYFPGYYASVPVLGAVLFLKFGESSKWSRRGLFIPLNWLGERSYTLYLLHWPILSILSLQMGNTISVSLKILGIAFGVILSAVVYSVVERPQRRQKWNISKLFQFVLGFSGVALVGLVILFFKGFPFRYPDLEVDYDQYALGLENSDFHRRSNCPDFKITYTKCFIADPSKAPTVALIGDSQVVPYFAALSAKFQGQSENLIAISKYGTPPFSKVVSKRKFDENFESVFSWLDSNPSIKRIILAAQWSNYFEESGILVAGKNYKNRIEYLGSTESSQAKIFELGLGNTLDRLMKNSKLQISFVYSPPVAVPSSKECLGRPNQSRRVCEFERQIFDSSNGYKQIFEKILSSHPAISRLDPSTHICDDRYCYTKKDGVLIYDDELHISSKGAEMLSKALHF